MLNRETTHAYIDECGNFGYDFTTKGTSDYFLVCAVLVEPENIDYLVKVVREQVQNDGELKSYKVGVDHAKRFRTLQALLKVQFHVIYIVLDKEKIYPDTGLSWKKTFFKYAHKHLYGILSKWFESLNITSDEYGDIEFMESFDKYIEKNCGSLFNEYTFKFDKSKHNELLQLADFIAGTIYLGFQKEIPKYYQPYMKYLRDKILDYDIFPRDYKNYLVEQNAGASMFDKKLQSRA